MHVYIYIHTNILENDASREPVHVVVVGRNDNYTYTHTNMYVYTNILEIDASQEPVNVVVVDRNDYIYIYIYIYIYTYMHTHTHTHTCMYTQTYLKMMQAENK